MTTPDTTPTPENRGWSYEDKALAGLTAILFAGSLLFSPLIYLATITGTATVVRRMNAGWEELTSQKHAQDKGEQPR